MTGSHLTQQCQVPFGGSVPTCYALLIALTELREPGDFVALTAGGLALITFIIVALVAFLLGRALVKATDSGCARDWLTFSALLGLARSSWYYQARLKTISPQPGE